MSLSRSNFHQLNEVNHIHSYPNQKKQYLLSQLPDAKQYIQHANRRHFYDLNYRSQIRQNNMMYSPQRYSRQHRLAEDKNYLRSLNTVDIEGAKSNSKLSQAVKNKIRAQQILENNKKNVPIGKLNLLSKNNQDYQRRKIAQEQEYKIANQKEQKKQKQKNKFEIYEKKQQKNTKKSNIKQQQFKDKTNNFKHSLSDKNFVKKQQKIPQQQIYGIRKNSQIQQQDEINKLLQYKMGIINNLQMKHNYRRQFLPTYLSSSGQLSLKNIQYHT